MYQRIWTPHVGGKSNNGYRCKQFSLQVQAQQPSVLDVE